MGAIDPVAVGDGGEQQRIALPMVERRTGMLGS